MKKYGTSLLFICFLLINIHASNAETKFTIDQSTRVDINRIEKYLNELTTLDSRFIQFSQDGIVEGRILLSRPYAMRIEYDPPTPVLMVAKGPTLMYHDKDLLQTSYLPVNETPIFFLLQERINLFQNIVITNFERGPASLRITLQKSQAPNVGSVTLTFEDLPLRLVKWKIKDIQGNKIDVALQEPKFGNIIDKQLFSLVDPAANINIEGSD
jgi:outer membrane lipoprotein-sorting protein